MKKWKTIKSDYLYQTPFGNIRRDKCQLENGLVIEDYHVCEYVDWVNCVAVTPENKILFVRQYRHGAGDFFLEIPAGTIEECEAHETAAVRELLEETGYSSDSRPCLLSRLYTNPARNNNRIYSYFLRDVRKRDVQHLDLAEELEVYEYGLEDVERLICTGAINQMYTVCAIQMAKKYLK